VLDYKVGDILTVGATMIELLERIQSRCFCGNRVFTSNVRLSSAIVYYCDQCGKVFHRQSPDNLIQIDDPELKAYFANSSFLVWSGKVEK